MANPLKATLSLDTNDFTGGVNKATNSLKGLNGYFAKNKNAIDGVAHSLQSFKYAYEGISKIFQTAIKPLVEQNIQMQNLKNQMSSLIFATTSNITKQGELLNVTQKQNLANMEATKTIKQLVEINKQTPHSLKETIAIYNTLQTGFKKVGASVSDMVQITKSLSIAAKAGNIQMNSLLAGVDGLATGTVLANSDLGRFLSSIGLTNEKIKSSTNVVKLFTDELGKFQAIDSFDTRLSNLQNTFNQLQAEVGKPIFDYLGDGIKRVDEYLKKIDFKSLNKDMHVYYEVVKKIAVAYGSYKIANIALSSYNATKLNAINLLKTYGTVNQSLKNSLIALNMRFKLGNGSLNAMMICFLN